MMPPDAFSIRLLPANERCPDGERLGEIRVGSFVEKFSVHPFAGDENALSQRWVRALRSLIAGADAVGLPIASNLTWVLYRSGSKIFVQQRLMLTGVGPKLLPTGEVSQIPSRKTVNEDGHRISEWATTIEAIAAFLKTT